ncbi:MAG: hypothetical protein Q4C74_05225 [Rothia sp. (in: high G+C Gram-positive bacteria)]|nr:hypothetical protein [Rothia sp. (in: high G+C Gram-positive bacteria)]
MLAEHASDSDDASGYYSTRCSSYRCRWSYRGEPCCIEDID